MVVVVVAVVVAVDASAAATIKLAFILQVEYLKVGDGFAYEEPFLSVVIAVTPLECHTVRRKLTRSPTCVHF